MTLAERLADQNHLHAWADCNARGLPHLWQLDIRVGSHLYWKCWRCPVGTMNSTNDPRPSAPSRFLGQYRGE